MPGICGIISKKIPAPDCEHAVKAMAATMRYKPFHATRFFCGPEMGIFAASVALESASGGIFSTQKKMSR